MSFEEPGSQKEKNLTCETVVNCYSAVDKFFPSCGLFDLTEGIYHRDKDLSYEKAQKNQHEYLLDQAKCIKNSKLLEIGSGYGTLLNRIKQRGSSGVGITISDSQAKFCRMKDLKAMVLDYKALPDDWNKTFDSVIANGSMEHFVSTPDGVKGRANDIYKNLFSTIHRVINPESQSRRFISTVIHFIRNPEKPANLLMSPLKHKKGSDDFHYAILSQGWGGFYPYMGQLEECSKGYFKLIQEVDGTEDYYLTSMFWLRRVQKAMLSPLLLKVIYKSFPVLFRKPKQLFLLLYGSLFSQSWSWQFKGENPPTRLLRQTWEYIEK